MECHIFLGRREGPGNLKSPLLVKDKPQLAGRAQSLGASRAIGRARSCTRECAEQVLVKKAALTARLLGLYAPRCHLPRPSRVRVLLRRATASKRTARQERNDVFRKEQQVCNKFKSLHYA